MDKITLKKVKENLQNHTENIVLETMKKMLKDEKFDEVCTCEQCLLDIATYSLNKIPAKYTSTHKGSIHTKIKDFEQQHQVDIIKIITKAIEIISQNPSENCSQK